jgi:hypothetical protein
VVLDEGVPRQLAVSLKALGIEAERFPKAFLGLRNGDLIRRLDDLGYDALLTNDKNIASQQSLKGRRIAVVALPHNRRSAILSRIDDIADTLRRVRAGHHVVIEWSGRRAMSVLVDGREESEDLPPVEPFDG